MPLNLALQAGSCRPIPVHGDCEFPHQQPQARVLYQHPGRADVLAEPTRDGTDYHVFCTVHQWAAPAVGRVADCGACPQCIAEWDAGPGRRRYLQLMQVGAVREGR